MSRGQILVVDDEEQIRRLVRLYLEREGYDVRCCGDGDEALDEARRHPPDLVVLDLLLPGMDGLAVCRTLRSAGDVAVIMLSARATEQDRLAGLNGGADDFMTKPFSPRELAARVTTVLRRLRRRPAAGPPVAAAASPPLDVAGLQIDTIRREVRTGERSVDLTPTEFRILSCLADAGGRTLSRGQLIDRAFGDDFDGFDRNVDVHVMNLRRKLALDPSPVQTVHGIGYKLERP